MKASLAKRLVAWYRKNRRPMPWRLAPSPYVCWLSEIMMQQTTYEQALPYFERFCTRFKTVEALAAADEQDVLKCWEGLGYYARARNLAKAARLIVQNGWPADYASWLALPGIGPYTAAALASVVNGAPTPVVDGNVARVFSRVWHLPDNFKDVKPRVRLARRLEKLMAPDIVPGDFNQAMMELGALVCSPSSPDCSMCPIAADCAACKAKDALSWPHVVKRKTLPTRKCTFVVIGDGRGRVLMVQNRERALLKGLWQLPVLDSALAYVQAFTHFKLHAEVLAVPKAQGVPVFVDPAMVPLTTAARRILIRENILDG